MSRWTYTEEDYLRDELAKEREARERIERCQSQERKERQERIREGIEQSYRAAGSWPEAFESQKYLLQRELNRCCGEPGDDADFWQASIEANAKAAELWPIVEGKYTEQISALLQQVQDLQEKMRLEVADTLEASDPRREFAGTAQQIRDNDICGFLEW